MLKPGNYSTRNGCMAIIHFILQTPTLNAFRAHGEYFDGSNWYKASWTLEGKYLATGKHDLDIVVPTFYVPLYADTSMGLRHNDVAPMYECTHWMQVRNRDWETAVILPRIKAIKEWCDDPACETDK